MDLGVGFSESDHGFRVLDLVDLRFQVLVLGFLSLWWVRELRVRVWSPESGVWAGCGFGDQVVDLGIRLTNLWFGIGLASSCGLFVALRWFGGSWSWF